jgi:UDP-N-acetyl-L-fucosamine synthase
VLGEIQPDAVLILGDTNSCLAAIAAKRRKIPVFHMEAGNRCFDQRVPEEINRRIVDHISDINLPYSSISREYLLREGLPPDRVIKTGSPMYEVLHHYLPKIETLRRSSTGLDLSENEYFVVSSHREENIDDPRAVRQARRRVEPSGQAYGLRHRLHASSHAEKTRGGAGAIPPAGRVAQASLPDSITSSSSVTPGPRCRTAERSPRNRPS